MRAVNLIPSDQRGGGGAVGVGRSQGGAYAVLALFAGLALMAVLYGLAHRQINNRRSEAASVTAKAQSAQAAADQLAPYTNFIAMREQRMQAVNTLVNSRFDWAHAFHEFGRVLPAQAWVTSLTGTIGSATTSTTSTSTTSTTGASTPPATPVTSATPPGSVPTFTIAGCAVSQPAVALMLERLRLIDGVSEVKLQSSTKTPSSGGGSGGAGGCPNGDPAYTATVNFEPLPAASTTAAGGASTPASATSSAGATSK